jgi:hypothetical protein
MKYKLTIIKYEPNSDYEAEMAKYKDNNFFSRRNGYVEDENTPRMEKAERSLEVFLTEEEYKKVKQEVIKVFE